MALEFTDTVATLSGVAPVQDAEPLLEWLQANPGGALDLTACEHLHAAVLQVILRTGVTIRSEPADRDLATWLRSAGTG